MHRVSDALDAIIPADSVIEKLAGDMVFTEGPVWIKGDTPHLLFSDIPANVIYRWAEGDTEASVFYDQMYKGKPREVFPRLERPDSGCGRPTAGVRARQPAHFAHGGRREWVSVVDNYEGDRLNSPNDAVWHANGWLYFTDPPYGLVKRDEDPDKELEFNGIFRLNYESGELQLLNREQTRPNGIGFSPDGKTAYVSNSDDATKVWMSYDVTDEGLFENGRVFFDVTSDEAPGLPDGLKLDMDGNLYATGPGGVWIFTPAGQHLGTIQPAEVPANVAWGDDGSSLYMTARTGLYRIKLLAKGPMPADMAD